MLDFGENRSVAPNDCLAADDTDVTGVDKLAKKTGVRPQVLLPAPDDLVPALLHIRMTDPAQLAFLSKLDSTAIPPNTIFVFDGEWDGQP